MRGLIIQLKYFALGLAITLLAPGSASAVSLQLDDAPIDEIVVREALAIGSVGSYGRWPVQRDALQARIARGEWAPPSEGDTLTLADGTERSWTRIEADEDGRFSMGRLRNGWVYFAVESEREHSVLLHAKGHGAAYVNGEPRSGNPYGYDYWIVPVQLQAGRNDFLLRHTRGSLEARLRDPQSALIINTLDATLPDLLIGEEAMPERLAGAVAVMNASAEPVGGWIRAAVRLEDEEAPLFDSLGEAFADLLPFSAIKLPFDFAAPRLTEEKTAILHLEMLKRDETGSAEPAASATMELRVVQADQPHKRTFFSQIDHSVQYYALTPATPLPDDETTPSLVLSLHGASVEAIGQAQAYNNKSWAHIVAPTNRRPYGFDWEDWGRLDAMEVLGLAMQEFEPDPTRIYLTGHSMGGHGTWQIGAHFPERFAAIGPSAGWISFSTYGQRPDSNDEPDDPTTNMLHRARASSDTLALLKNYGRLGVYILHGGDDSTVSPEEARTMVEHLEGFHRDFVYHEEPGQGHWWDLSNEPGADCVDWAPMFDFFSRRVRPKLDMVRDVDFTTVNPGISSSSHWAQIIQQERMLEPSRIQLRYDPGLRRFSGITENTHRLALDLRVVREGGPVGVEIDGSVFTLPEGMLGIGALYLLKEDGVWTAAGAPPRNEKGPHRYGPFKEAFQHRMIFVYGTQGEPDENAWALAKARHDAETWWYRGNGTALILPDMQFLEASALFRENSVILYGHAQSNAAWGPLLRQSPVRAERGRITVGDRVFEGDDLACLFVYPRPGAHIGSVAAVSGSGLAGLRVTDHLPYFISGAAYPDCLVLSSQALEEGDAGVLAAGFFGVDWSVENGEFAWRE